MNTPEFIKKGTHTFIAGSTEHVIGDYTLYVHYDQRRIIGYVRGKNSVQINEFFDTQELYDQALAYHKKNLSAVASAALVKDISHKLMVGTVLVGHSNTKQPEKDMVRFFQVTELLSVGTVKLQEINMDSLEFEAHFRAVPLVGSFKGAGFSGKVYANTIKLDDDMLLLPSKFDVLALGDVSVKVYESHAYAHKIVH